MGRAAANAGHTGHPRPLAQPEHLRPTCVCACGCVCVCACACGVCLAQAKAKAMGLEVEGEEDAEDAAMDAAVAALDQLVRGQRVPAAW